jgi:alkanesulfonate monooxygenase SsuD/methylene tetrahydromethanopterin reductase-like flavin-dependent oxidoreductase (luciferase family)
VRLGVLLPTFRRSPDAALAAATRATRAGLDGVFAYDHIWPMGSPDRPALAPFEVLATVAVNEPALAVGPLVARVGLVDDHVLLSQLRALHLVAGGRLVAGIGTGDRKSADENLAYGVPVASVEARRASLRSLATALIADEVEVWIGDGAPATRDVAHELGCTLNLWQASPERVAELAARGPVSWAGAAPTRGDALDEAACASLLEALQAAGSTWAVFTPSMDPEVLVTIARGANAQG